MLKLKRKKPAWLYSRPFKTLIALIGLPAMYVAGARTINSLSRLISHTPNANADILPGDLLPDNTTIVNGKEVPIVAGAAIGEDMTVYEILTSWAVMDGFFFCLGLATIFYLLFRFFICESEFVKQASDLKKCRKKKCKWYQVRCKLKKLWCFIKEIIRWILQFICQNLELIATLLFIICVIVQILLYLMWMVFCKIENT